MLIPGTVAHILQAVGGSPSGGSPSGGGCDATTNTITPDAVTWSGPSDRLAYGPASSPVSSKTWTISLWARPTLQSIIENYFGCDFSTNAGGMYGRFGKNATGQRWWDIAGLNSSGTTIVRYHTGPDVITTNTWNHFVVSFDLTDTNKRHAYMNGAVVSGSSWLNYTNDNISFKSWCIGDKYAQFDQEYKGDMAEVFIHNQYIDLSQSSNLDLFAQSSGGYWTPTDLGSDGCGPFNEQPLIYIKGDAASVGGSTPNFGSLSNSDFSFTGSVTNSTNEPVRR